MTYIAIKEIGFISLDLEQTQEVEENLTHKNRTLSTTPIIPIKKCGSTDSEVFYQMLGFS
jgi:hypothetical protein